jgi:hypothetical protein
MIKLRQVKALCAQCQGFEGYAKDCTSYDCPIFGCIEGQDTSKAIPWYLHPTHSWPKMSELALTEGRMEPLPQKPEPTEEQRERGRKLQGSRTRTRSSSSQYSLALLVQSQ